MAAETQYESEIESDANTDSATPHMEVRDRYHLNAGMDQDGQGFEFE